jgi:UDP-N-acetylmuramyl pentapeptide phosphotransferase/UDP-N-acetylglucosamine-1-phosphate transferase
MLHFAIIFGWVIAFGLMVYLATQAIKRRLLDRRRKKRALRKIREFRRHHHFDEKRQRWVRNVDGVVLTDDFR